MAMKPAKARESWPEKRIRNIEVARMPLMPIWAMSSVCEFQTTGSVKSWMKKSIRPVRAAARRTGPAGEG